MIPNPSSNNENRTHKAEHSEWYTGLLKEPLLSRKEELQLFEKIAMGDEKAREQMVKANLRLVVKIAHDYDYGNGNLADLIAEGNIGLMKAIDRFDSTLGNKLSTYAAWWIKQAIRRALSNQTKTIRLPVHMEDKIAKIRKVASKLEQDLGQAPSDEEIGLELGISTEKVTSYLSYGKRTIPLDAPISEGSNSDTVYNSVADESATSSAEQCSRNEQIDLLLSTLGQVLTPREEHVIRARFLGIHGQNKGDPMTLEQVGQSMAVTRERIRQIEVVALKKLRRAFEKINNKREIDVDQLVAVRKLAIENANLAE